MKSIPADEFFKQVAINSGTADLKTVRDVYYGMVRTIARELKARHTVMLPDWGEFYITIHKARRFVDVTGKPGELPALPTVKFAPYIGVKKYFYSLGEERTVVK